MEGLENQDIATTFKAAGDQLRIDILRVLKDASFGVQELASIFDMPQPGMSHHLKVLSRSHLVTSRREGNCFFYRRPIIPLDSPMKSVLNALFATIDRLDLRPEYGKKIEAIHDQRRKSSMEFFSRNSELLFEHQARIASYDRYSQAARELLEQVAPEKKKLALEVGPGQGGFLLELTRVFEQVIALDNADEMLAKARRTIEKNGLADRVSWLHGELGVALAEGLKVDFLALNMVLHHMANPSEMFSGFYKLLNKNGVLFIVDLCPHDQEWAREACGDIWMGFEGDELENWAQKAGFSSVQSSYLGLKNGFQIQLKAFRKF